MDLFEERRACRAFTDEAIPREDLEKIVHAGLITPTAMNQQDIDILVVTDKEKLQVAGDKTLGVLPPETLARFEKRRKDLGVKNPITYDAPAFFLLHINERKYEGMSMFHAGSMTMSIVLAAKKLGYDSVIVGIISANYGDWEETFNLKKGSLCIGISVGKRRPDVTFLPKEILCKAVIQ